MVAAIPTYPDLISMNPGNNNVDDKKSSLSIVSSKPFVSASGLRLSFKEENEKHEDREIDLGPNYEPSPFDVICAKGKDAKDHTGNKRFRMLVDMSLQKYREAKSKILKSTIVTDIVDAVMGSSPDGGFIKMIEGTWHKVTDHHAREKVGQCFRDRLHYQYKSSSKAKIRKRKVEDERLMLGYPISPSPFSNSANEGEASATVRNEDHQNKSLPNPHEASLDKSASLQRNSLQSQLQLSSSILGSSLPEQRRNMVLSQAGDLPLERIRGQRTRTFQMPDPLPQNMFRNHMMSDRHLTSQLDWNFGKQIMDDTGNFDDPSLLKLRMLHQNTRISRVSRNHNIHDNPLLMGGMQPALFPEEPMQNFPYGVGAFLDAPTPAPIGCYQGFNPSSNRMQHLDAINMPAHSEANLNRFALGINELDTSDIGNSISRREGASFQHEEANPFRQGHGRLHDARQTASQGLLSIGNGSDRVPSPFSREFFGGKQDREG